MAYREHTRTLVKTSQLTPGSRLGRRAVFLDISVIDIAKLTGATRKTVYNWFRGGYVIPAYRDRVQAVYEILKNASSRDDALRSATRKFGKIL